MVPVLLVDVGLFVVVAGAVLLRAPLAVAGLVVLAIGLLLPVRPPRLPGPPMALDGIIPEYEFGEHHEIHVDAAPERVLSAVRTVTARDIRFFRLLVWLRSPGLAGGKESILNPAPDEPILAVATRSGFVVLHDDSPSEIVLGTILGGGTQVSLRSADEFHAREGSLVRAVMGFHATAEGNATRLVTQTRVHASDTAARRRFAAYWRLIYPGSAFIRRMWLRAIRARAEAPASGPRPDGATAGA